MWVTTAQQSFLIGLDLVTDWELNIQTAYSQAGDTVQHDTAAERYPRTGCPMTMDANRAGLGTRR